MTCKPRRSVASPAPDDGGAGPPLMYALRRSSVSGRCPRRSAQRVLPAVPVGAALEQDACAVIAPLSGTTAAQIKHLALKLPRKLALRPQPRSPTPRWQRRRRGGTLSRRSPPAVAATARATWRPRRQARGRESRDFRCALARWQRQDAFRPRRSACSGRSGLAMERGDRARGSSKLVRALPRDRVDRRPVPVVRRPSRAPRRDAPGRRWPAWARCLLPDPTIGSGDRPAQAWRPRARARPQLRVQRQHARRACPAIRCVNSQGSQSAAVRASRGLAQGRAARGEAEVAVVEEAVRVAVGGQRVTCQEPPHHVRTEGLGRVPEYREESG